MKKSSLVVLMSLVSSLALAQSGARQAAPTATGTRTGVTAPSAAGSTGSAGSVGNAGSAAGSGSLANPTSSQSVNNSLPSVRRAQSQSTGSVSVGGLTSSAPAVAAPAARSARSSEANLNSVVETRVERAFDVETKNAIASIGGNANQIDTAIEQEVASHALALDQMNIDHAQEKAAAIADAAVAKATGTTVLDSGVADCAQNMDAEAQSTLAALTIAGGEAASKGIASVAAAAQAKHQESTGKGSETFGKLAGPCKLVKQQVVSAAQ